MTRSCIRKASLTVLSLLLALAVLSLAVQPAAPASGNKATALEAPFFVQVANAQVKPDAALIGLPQAESGSATSPPTGVDATKAREWLMDDAAQSAIPVHGGDILRPPTAPATVKHVGAQDLAHRLAVYYALPTDVSFDQRVLDRLKEASLDIQAWYQVATGGLTWEWAYPEIVRVYQGENTREYYKETGNWWGSLLPEMGEAGFAIWEPGIVTAIWAQGAGWWAGGAQGCEVDCGIVLLGVELFPEFNDPEWSGGMCPDPTGYGVDVWPCTPEGAYAHELGHTLGLGHPIDDPVTAPYAFHSIMQTHWNYPDEAAPDERPWGFLRTERWQIRRNPFMKAGISLIQKHQAADIVVNLPIAGAPPLASFELTAVGNQITTSNTTAGADLNYWTFGDYGSSNVLSPTHVYQGPGAYTVTLRASSDLAMMSVVTHTVVIEIVPHNKLFLPAVIKQ